MSVPWVGVVVLVVLTQHWRWGYIGRTAGRGQRTIYLQHLWHKVLIKINTKIAVTIHHPTNFNMLLRTCLQHTRRDQISRHVDKRSFRTAGPWKKRASSRAWVRLAGITKLSWTGWAACTALSPDGLRLPGFSVTENQYRKPRVRRVPESLPCAIHRAHDEEPIWHAGVRHTAKIRVCRVLGLGTRQILGFAVCCPFCTRQN